MISISNTTKNLLQKVLFQLKFHKFYYCFTCLSPSVYINNSNYWSTWWYLWQ